MSASLRLFSAAGTFLGELPDYKDLSIQDPWNDVGGWSFKYNRSGENFSQLIVDEDRQFSLLLDGLEPFRGLLEEDSDNEAQAKSAEVTFSGRSVGALFQYCVVYPVGGVGTKPASQTFAGVTVGALIRTLILQGQARGALTGLSTDATNTNDSAGTAWVQTITITINAGVTVLDVLRSLSANRWLDWRMSGSVLKMYKPDTTIGIDRTGVIFRRGINIATASRKRSRTELGTVALVTGDADTSVERVDASAVAARGRKEILVSQSGITDAGTMNVIGDATLAVTKQPRLEKGHQVRFTAGCQPWVDFFPGDYVYTDVTGTIEKLRVVDLAVTFEEGFTTKGEFKLNDRFKELEERLADKVEGIITGMNPGGGSSATEPDIPGADNTIPERPASLSASSAAYTDDKGRTESQATLTWPPTTTNTDTTAIDDLAGYEFHYKADYEVVRGLPEDLLPVKTDNTYTKKFDRRGSKSAGYVSGFNAGSCRLATNKDWWPMWGAYYGLVDASGKISTVNDQLLRNMIVRTEDGTNEFTSITGGSNLLPKEDATFDSTVGTWVSSSNATLSRNTTTKYEGAAALHILSPAAADSVARTASGSSGVAVTAGSVYSVSARSKVLTGSQKNWRLGIIWYNASNGVISTSESSNLPTPSGGLYAHGFFTATAPSGAVRAAVQVRIVSAAVSDVHIIDAVDFSPGNNISQSFSLPIRKGSLFEKQSLFHPEELGLVPLTRTNLITNPSFETNISGWSIVNSAALSQTSTEAKVGTRSMRLTLPTTASDTGTSYAFTTAASTTYTFSIYVKTDKSVRLQVSGAGVAATVSGTAQFISGWTRLSITFTSVAGGGAVALAVLTLGATSGELIFVDAAQLEVGDAATSYIDGARGSGYAWTGTAHASTSTVTQDASAGYFWCEPTGVIKSSTDVFVLYTLSGGDLLANSINDSRFLNKTIIARYDATTQAFEDAVVWRNTDTTKWGVASYDGDATFMYIVGTTPAGASMLMRVPQSNIYSGTQEFWTGAGWSTTRSSAGTWINAEITGLRFWSDDSLFHAITMDATARVFEYTGSAIQGPFTLNPTPVWTTPQHGITSNPNEYVPFAAKYHPQFDGANRGAKYSYCLKSKWSPPNLSYVATPRFGDAPLGSRITSMPGVDWSPTEWTDSPPGFVSGLRPGANFYAEVRAVDENNNRSSWRPMTAPVILAEDATPTAAPSVPIVTSLFRGIRVTWDGMDLNGVPLTADYTYMEIHISDQDNFTPDAETLVDRVTTYDYANNTTGFTMPYFDNFEFGTTYYVRFVAVDINGNKSIPSDTGSTAPQQLSDPDLPAKLVTGAKIADQSISVKNITVATFEESVILNGNFEDEATDGLGAALNQPSHWRLGAPINAGGTFALEKSTPIGGSQSLTSVLSALNVGQRFLSDVFPVVPTDIYYWEVAVRANRTLPGPGFEAHLVTGNSRDLIETNPIHDGTNVDWGTPIQSGTSTTAVEIIESQRAIPAGHTWAVLMITALGASDAGWTAFFDNVAVRHVVGTANIANASINNAKIANLAVDDAKIGSVSAGKITVGSLVADVTVAARIKTANTGARVELNSSGLQAFNAAGNKTVDVAAATGSATFTGTFQTDFDNSTSPHMKIQDSGDRTTIYFYDNSGLAGAGNFAFINTPADANNDPRVGINSAEFDFGSGVMVRQRVFLNTIGGMQIESYRIDDATKFPGGRLNLGPSGSQLDHRQPTGTQNGGAVFVDGNGFILARNSAGTSNGAVISGGTNDLTILVDNTGTAEIEIIMEDDGLISFWRGKWPNFVDLGSRQALFTGGVNVASGTSWATSYGTAKTGGVSPIATPRFGGAVGWCATAASNSAFTISSTATTSGAIYFWCFRV